jgi:hypothetical protein
MNIPFIMAGRYIFSRKVIFLSETTLDLLVSFSMSYSLRKFGKIIINARSKNIENCQRY